MFRVWLCGLALVLSACQCNEGKAKEPLAAGPGSKLGAWSAPAKPVPLAVCRAQGKEPLAAAREYYDAERFEEALSCAAQAAANTPEDPSAHSERAAALTALGRLPEAQLAYARALAMDPNHLDALLGAGHLFGTALPSSRENDELAAIYSEHGLELAEDLQDEELVFDFAALSAMVLNDLGQSGEALERAELALQRKQADAGSRYERGVALFELGRFTEARAVFEGLLEDSKRSAHAHQYLGLILEREGQWQKAEQHLSQARTLAPEDFPNPQLLPPEEFRAEVDKAIAELPMDMRADLQGVPVLVEELPDWNDLKGEPPLSPAIVGLYRGPPLKESCDGLGEQGPCRSVVLYRRNLARAVKNKDELLEQIRVTILHEVGHLRGEDDYELAARGLE